MLSAARFVRPEMLWRDEESQMRVLGVFNSTRTYCLKSADI